MTDIRDVKLAEDPARNLAVLREFALGSGVSALGVCDAAAVRECFHPSLSENPRAAQMTRAISMAFHLSDAIMDGVANEPTPLYAMHYNRVNSFLDNAALALTSVIQESGFSAIPIAASQIVDKGSQRGHLNHKIVARAAGLGHIGRNNLLVVPGYGSRVRLVTVLTDSPLETTAPRDADCGSCRACVSACPVGAIGESSSDFSLAKCVEAISRFQRIMFVAKGICGVCVRACRGSRG